MNETARAVWAKTRVLLWPQRYVLASLPLSGRADAASLVARHGPGFAALVVERDEVSVTVTEEAWKDAGLEARRLDGPFRAITLDVNIDLAVVGYMAPLAARLAAAGVSIIPQCAFLKDHLLIHERHAERAVAEIERMVREASG
jgi:hypothetical protein